MFFENYQNWDNLSLSEKKNCVAGCVKFYEDRTVQYILSNLPVDKAGEYKREAVKLEFVENQDKDVAFSDNAVSVLLGALSGAKKDLFFKVAQNTICAVFANMFKNTSSNAGRKTKFSSIAGGFLASITSEFAKGEQFESDMMEEFASVFAQETVLE